LSTTLVMACPFFGQSDRSCSSGGLLSACSMSSISRPPALISLTGQALPKHPLNKVLSSSLQTVYFGGSFVGPVAFNINHLQRSGYKRAFMLRLITYGLGAIHFWPCAKYRSFTGFCACAFVVSMGLRTLKISANP